MTINNKNILIIDNRKELSTKYKKLLEQSIACNVTIKGVEDSVFDYIKMYEPDMIIVSDSLKICTESVCVDIRAHIKDYRPIIIILSKSSHIDDKLENLKAGADDFISEPIENREFAARAIAHLRRSFEENSDRTTALPKFEVTQRILKRAIASKQKLAVILTDVDYLAQYREIYGDIAKDKLLQTYAAIINSTTDESDFIGHMDKDNFIIATTPEKADKIAKTLKYAFDKIASRFYTQEDAQRGYIILYSDKTAGMRVPLVATSIAVVNNEFRSFESSQEIINAIFCSHKLAKSQAGSFILKDAPQICGIDSIERPRKNKVLVVEKDAALAYLITSTLEMQGNKTQAISSYDKVEETIADFSPDIVIMDAGEVQNQRGLDICEKIKNNTLKIIISTVMHNKEQVLNAGADLYLPKPYDILTLHSWVNRFLED